MTGHTFARVCWTLVAALLLAAAQAAAQQPPFSIGEICKGVDICAPPRTACSASGFRITLTNFSPAPPSSTGAASYTYTICSPPAGTCTGTARPGESCLDHKFCQSKGQTTDPSARCTRDCATQEFRNLSHFDVVFPQIGASCGDAIDALISRCEALCGADHKTISASGCIQALDAFNNSVDTLTPTPAPFNNPGPAQPAYCQAAGGNGIVIGKPPYCK